MTKVYIVLLVTLTVFTTTSALSHRARVWIRRAGGDKGKTVELKATLQFIFFPNPGITASGSLSLEKKSNFPDDSGLIIDRVFVGDPLTIRLRVWEDDGQASKNDGVCLLAFQPGIYEAGNSALYQCIREKDNGLSQDWIVDLRVTSFIPTP